MREMRILVNYTGRNGAGPIFSYEMTRGLLQNGVKVVAIISKDIENLSDWEKLDLEKLIIIPTYSGKLNYLWNTFCFGAKQKRYIKKQTKQYRFDAIYVPMMCLWTKRINRLFPSVPVFDTLHDPIRHSGEKWYLRGYKPQRSTKKIIVLSKQFVTYVQDKYHKPALWIPHGRFSYYKEKFFSEFISSDTINFVFFGRIEEYKGLKVLASAFHIAAPSMSKFTLTIAGPGNWSEYEKDFDGIPNVKVCNRWFGPRDINELFSVCNTVTVLPYIDATQSGVIPVAQEYCSPVIASDAGGLREQIENNVTGYLFENGNPDALAECLLRVYHHFDDAKTLAENAQRKLEELNWDKLAQKLVEEVMA